MSDYLGNLITRTLSPSIAVRPQLPSLFEAGPKIRETKSEPEFEQQSFVEQAPVTRPSEKLAPIPLSILTPHQSVFREPEQTIPQIFRTRRILQTSPEFEPDPLPTPILRQSTPQEPSRIFSGKEDAKRTPKPAAPVQPRILSQAVPTLRDDKPSNSTRRRSDVIKSPLPDVIASASQEVSAREEIPPQESAIALNPVVVPELREHELFKRSGVQPVVPTIRSLPPIPPLPPAAAIATPSINVTIGRVEIRAVSPPAQQRAKPKPAPVLSLEDYLRQRSKGAA